ncbi:hypothetical protein B0T26DRAFT_803386 [Lasiosphaeria miniovina]|uniref:Uncharacterized protein n=1 Tax=Lasiosphaeria miniovina TaxID=1954250 RepID=A0AA40AMI4_9PEZI|nr:uncharacterized protein B0T26DRAFT_803386 [Lasiosphaeria miniovina]KAK0718573.1 hypothetical protein B0T26DRAFT_803386 [Lasiosphaeria miniovina]
MEPTAHGGTSSAIAAVAQALCYKRGHIVSSGAPTYDTVTHGASGMIIHLAIEIMTKSLKKVPLSEISKFNVVTLVLASGRLSLPVYFLTVSWRVVKFTTRLGDANRSLEPGGARLRPGFIAPEPRSVVSRWQCPYESSRKTNLPRLTEKEYCDAAYVTPPSLLWVMMLFELGLDPKGSTFPERFSCENGPSRRRVT